MDDIETRKREQTDAYRCWLASQLAEAGTSRDDMPDYLYRLITRMRTLGVIPRRGVHKWACTYSVEAVEDNGHQRGTAGRVVAREPAEAAIAAVAVLGIPRPRYGLASIMGQCTPRVLSDPLAPAGPWTFTYDSYRLTVTDTGGRVHISEIRRDAPPPSSG